MAPPGDPLVAFYCHCEACRRAFGAPVNMGVTNLAEHVTVIEVGLPCLHSPKHSA